MVHKHGLPNSMKIGTQPISPKAVLTRPLDKSAYLKIIFSDFSTKTYVVGTQKKRLNETVLLSTQNTRIN